MVIDQFVQNRKYLFLLLNGLREEMASAIPMGQPTLIGHNFEKRDRNYRNKIYSAMGRSIEKSKEAAYYAEKAKPLKTIRLFFRMIQKHSLNLQRNC
ncbi:MAG: DUF3560 domain-containing protein [Chryseobacterium sp.]|nr:MAG: DUF3560 domain-containing protein [Chryseobacterium sp.]